MAEILYKPVCSDCGAIIDDEVYGVRCKTIVENNRYRLYNGSCIHPARCEKCGAWFDSVVKDVNNIRVVDV